MRGYKGGNRQMIGALAKALRDAENVTNSFR